MLVTTVFIRLDAFCASQAVAKIARPASISPVSLTRLGPGGGAWPSSISARYAPGFSGPAASSGQDRSAMKPVSREAPARPTDSGKLEPPRLPELAIYDFTAA